MCDYSLHNVKTRPAKVGDKLITRQFHSGTTGFSAPEDASMAVCVLPGTELSFKRRPAGVTEDDRSGQVIAVDLGQPGQTGRSPKRQRKAAALVR